MPAPHSLQPGRILRQLHTNELFDLSAYTKANPDWTWPGEVPDATIGKLTPRTAPGQILAKLQPGSLVRFERLLYNARKVLNASGSRQAIEVTAALGGELKRGFIFSVYNGKDFVEPAGVDLEFNPGEQREFVFRVVKTPLGPVLVEGPRPPPKAEPVPPGSNLVEKLKNYYAQKGYVWDEVNLIGLRRSEVSHKNRYVDLFVVADDRQVVTFRCTTRHGFHSEAVYQWFDKNKPKSKPSYAADVAPGFYANVYTIGAHAGDALRQSAGDMQAFVPTGVNYEHYKRSKWFEKTPPVNGLVRQPAGAAWINIHRRPGGDAKGRDVEVGGSSAGCQVIPDHKDIDWMIARLRNTEKVENLRRAAKTPKQKQSAEQLARWSYLLVHSQEFPLYHEIDALPKGAP